MSTRYDSARPFIVFSPVVFAVFNGTASISFISKRLGMNYVVYSDDFFHEEWSIDRRIVLA